MLARPSISPPRDPFGSDAGKQLRISLQPFAKGGEEIRDDFRARVFLALLLPTVCVCSLMCLSLDVCDAGVQDQRDASDKAHRQLHLAVPGDDRRRDQGG